jgi:RNA polymerase sigma factor (sigma-70 family)
MRGEDFERLYDEHAESLLGFLRYRTGDHALAEDLAADTFERALSRRARFDPRRGNERAWLFTIARNLLTDRLRRTDAERRALERSGPSTPEAEPDPALDRVELREVLRAAMAELAPEEQDLLALRYGAGLSIAEIAELGGDRAGTVESRLYRALRKLRPLVE